MDQYIGKLLDNRYEIIERIGTGGMAVVYKGRDHRLNRLVAVKILKEELAQDAEFRRRFQGQLPSNPEAEPQEPVLPQPRREFVGHRIPPP